MSFGAGLLATATMMAMTVVAHAMPTVDGNASDWGVTVADANGSSFPTTVYSMTEDTSDFHGDSGYVGPNYGGQNYDVEYMAAQVHGTRVYLLMVSGLRPDNGLKRFGPGDIRVRNGSGTIYGIEIGGGVGGGDGSMLIEGQKGSTYKLRNNGYTISHADADAAQTTGSIWKDVTWVQDPINPKTPVQFEIDANSERLDINGAYSPVEYRYTRDTQTDEHSVIEMSFDLRTFIDIGHNGLLDIEWGPSCGNDVLHVTIPIPTLSTVTLLDVPEPGAILTFSLALAGLGGVAAKRRRTR